jgi:hypothetical protein
MRPTRFACLAAALLVLGLAALAACGGSSSPPAPPTCLDLVRNGAETDVDCGGPACLACTTGQLCAANRDCASGTCGAAGRCLAPTGAACLTNGSCGSDFCVDGVCCDTACAGLCQACSIAKKGSGAEGACGLIPYGMDPDNECAGPLSCNGAGACTAPACTNSVQDGAETDVDCGGPTCGPCANGRQCAVNGDCVSGLCAAGTCTPLAQGSACLSNGACGSGNCVDGVCCNTACAGACQVCSVALGASVNGTCGSAPAGTNPGNRCTAPQTCDGAGTCH